MDKSTALTVGSEVVVKSGVIDPDFGVEIAGWTGTVIEVEEAESLALIEWNAKTLESIGEAHIKACEAEELDWTQIYLELSEIELVNEVQRGSSETMAIMAEPALDGDSDKAIIQ